MSLLEKYQDKLNKNAEGIETFRASIQDVYAVAVADDATWRRIAVRTEKGTFYGFESALSGMKLGDFVPEKGIDAMITVRERKYTDKEGKEAETLDMIGCKVDMVTYRASVLKGTGLTVNLF